VIRTADRLKQAERDLGFAETGAAAGYHEGAAFYEYFNAKSSGELLGYVRAILDWCRSLSESEFEKRSQDPSGFLAGNLLSEIVL